jgi:hypothetical protein
MKNYKKKQWRPSSKKKRRGKNLSQKFMKACHAEVDVMLTNGTICRVTCKVVLLVHGCIDGIVLRHGVDLVKGPHVPFMVVALEPQLANFQMSATNALTCVEERIPQL